jgi:hypothetical protein
MSVVRFPLLKEPEVQHGYGEAFCIACNCTWGACAPTGTTVLECPNCKAMKGHFKFKFAPADGQFVYECDCGNQLFYLTPDGHLCANCGVYQIYD